MIKHISKKGVPLKITAEWTDTDYWDRRYEDSDEMVCENVAGWQIRINGLKFPRGHTDGNGEPDWTYRYTGDGKTEKGKRSAIDQALQSFEAI